MTDPVPLTAARHRRRSPCCEAEARRYIATLDRSTPSVEPREVRSDGCAGAYDAGWNAALAAVRSTPSVDGLRLSTVDFALAEAHVARAKRDRVMTTLRAALAATPTPAPAFNVLDETDGGKNDR